MLFSLLLLPVLYVLFAWWFSTGAILFLDGLPRWTYPLTMLAATVVLLAAFYGAAVTASHTTIAGVYCGFTCGLLAWGWNEIAFLFGYITGPRRSACPQDVVGRRRFRLATETILYHETAIALTFAGLVAVTWGEPNPTAVWTFAVLWAMRLSAKLNLFLGVRNLSESFLPPHLEYLKTYFLRRPINFLFPFVVSAATIAFAVFALRGLDIAAIPNGAPPSEVVFFVFLATLTGLGVLEHWFLVLPISSETLWKWGLISRTQLREHRMAARRALKGNEGMSAEPTKLEMSGRIGPNSVIQVYNALGELADGDDRTRVFEAAGLSGYLRKRPEQMIPEQDVIALHRALRETLSADLCDRVMKRAGETTADYLLANRIPRAVSALLKRLPPAAAAWILLNAISRNAWTFTGSGRFSWSAGRPWHLRIENSPLCRNHTAAAAPMCVYYSATFERLFRVLVSPAASVRETACGGCGESVCDFEAAW